MTLMTSGPARAGVDDNPNSRCHIQLLGGLTVTIAGSEISHFRTAKTGALLAYLAYHHRRTHPRELLVEQFWPECDPEAGRHSLSTALSALRHLFDQHEPGLWERAFLCDRQGVQPLTGVVTTDVARFEAAIAAAARATADDERESHLAAAVQAYRGDLLPGCYEEWVFPEQQRLQELFFRALAQLIGLLLGSGRADQALDYALQALRHDPLREECHQDVIRAFMALGRPEMASRHYEEFAKRCRQELDAEPSPETRSLLDAPPVRTSREPSPAPSVEAPEDSASILHDLEPIGGASPIGSRFYVVRPADAELAHAISRQDSILLIKGPRQVGKTSLLARGLHLARQSGASVAVTHLQALNSSQVESSGALLFALAESLFDQLDLPTPPAEVWDERRGASLNLRRYLRRVVLPNVPGHLVWALDEIDRIFSLDYGSEIFGLFRSWHDERALEPDCPWSRLSLAIAYSTEAHLFITDLNQSPFNVGTRFTLEDFTPDQVADLNRRHGSPIRDNSELARYCDLVGGQPYLVRCGLYQMASRRMALAEFEHNAAFEHGVLGDHLRRIGLFIRRDPGLWESIRGLLEMSVHPERDVFFRLRSAGVLSGDVPSEARFRCGLYRSYLAGFLAQGATA